MHFLYKENKYEKEWEQNSLLLLFSLGFFFLVCFSCTNFCQAKGMCEVKMERESLKSSVLVYRIQFLLPEVQGSVAK